MTYPAKVKTKATLLRKKGLSINEIASEIKIAKSTAFEWTKNIRLSTKAKDILNNKIQKRYFPKKNTYWMLAQPAKPRFWTTNKIELLKKYYSSGISMDDVAKKMGITLSSVIHIMKRRDIKRRPSYETRRNKFYKSVLSFTPKVKLSPSENILKTAGLMLYWGEGAKVNAHGVNFANSDPLMIRIFVKFLRTIYRVNEKRLRCMIYCYSNQNTDKLTMFWTSITQIPKSRFHRPYIRENGGNKHNKMKYGVLHVNYSDTRLLQLILKEIRLLSYNM